MSNKMNKIQCISKMICQQLMTIDSDDLLAKHFQILDDGTSINIKHMTFKGFSFELYQYRDRKTINLRGFSLKSFQVDDLEKKIFDFISKNCKSSLTMKNISILKVTKQVS